jgi:hypothetical protein
VSRSFVVEIVLSNCVFEEMYTIDMRILKRSERYVFERYCSKHRKDSDMDNKVKFHHTPAMGSE